MTKQEFINNFELEKKIEELNTLKNMSFEDWFLNKTKNNLANKGTIESIKMYLKYRKKYLKKTLSEQENIEMDKDFSFFIKMYKNRTSRLEQEIVDFYRDLEYFCEIPNLSFEEWLNTYYIENLAKIPEEEFALKYKKERLLRVDVFNGKLEEKEYLELMNHDPIEAYQSKTYIKSDYCEYLKTQITYPTISWIE